MFRFWAGATAGLIVGSLGFTGVSAEGLGSSVTPLSGSQASATYFLAEASYSSRSSAASLWSGASAIGFAKSADSAAITQTFSLVDFAPSSQFGVGISPLSFIASSPPKGMPAMTNSRVAVDTYFNVIETMSKQDVNGSRPGASFVTPMGGDSTSQPMR